MKRIISGLALFSVVAVGAIAQAAAPTDSHESFSFKGNILGMTLEQFKSNHSGDTLAMYTGNFGKKFDKKLLKAVPGPLCSDLAGYYDGQGADSLWRIDQAVPGLPVDLHPGEVYCNLSPDGGRNPSELDVSGQRVASVVYRFLNCKLFEIQIRFAAISFPGIERAFADKYGKPSETNPTQYQNGFGARWEGAGELWKNGTQTIFAYEGSKNGPAQDQFDSAASSSVTYEDTSLEPTPAKAAPNF